MFAAHQLVKMSKINYLVGDYLSEVTMGLLGRYKDKGTKTMGQGGYINDFFNIWKQLKTQIVKKNIKVIVNAGGLNPKGLKEAIEKISTELNIKVACIEGDDILSDFENLRKNVKPFDVENEQEDIPNEKFISANAYLGAFSIVEALKNGAQVIITGRCADSSIVLAPLIYEFDWKPTDYDLLAAGSLGGHIIECGCQCTGGNFTDWEKSIKNGWDNVGYPIIECSSDGTFIVTKPKHTGGLVSVHTVSEQLLYEIGNPKNYILPDCIVDFTNVKLKQIGTDRVYVSGVKGKSPTDYYKVSLTYSKGFSIGLSLLIGGVKAKFKAQSIAHASLKRSKRLFKMLGYQDFNTVDISYIGAEHLFGKNSKGTFTREVLLRIALSHSNPKALGLFAKELIPFALSSAPGICGLSDSSPKLKKVLHFSSCLIEKKALKPTATISNLTLTVKEPKLSHSNQPIIHNYEQFKEYNELDHLLLGDASLLQLCLGRSGDKGDIVNIGIISRKKEYYSFLRKNLTSKVVKSYLSHMIDGKVTRYELPGIYGFNFVCFDEETVVLMKDGTERKIKDIVEGDEVLGPDSKPRKVIDKVTGIDEMYKVTQITNHKDKKEIYGAIDFTCNSKHLLAVETPRFVGNISTRTDSTLNVPINYEFFAFNEEVKQTIVDNYGKRLIKMIKRKEKRYYHSTYTEKEAKKLAEQERNNIINRNGNNKIFSWLISARDVKYIGDKVRTSTYQSWCPILINNKNFRNKLENLNSNLFKNENNISKIAWLFGLWIGDGYSINPTIAVNIKDKDQIKRIQTFSNDLDLKASILKQSPKNKEMNHLCGFIEIHPNKQKIKSNGEISKNQNFTKENIFWTLILSFGMGKKTGKDIPKDLHLQEIFIREWFLAGLIDADGYLTKDNDISIVTIYSGVRDGVIKLSKSLGIRVSVSIRKTYIDKLGITHKRAYNVTLSYCSVLQSILSKCSITGKFYKTEWSNEKQKYISIGGSKSKFMKPPIKVEYLTQKFSFKCEKIKKYKRIRRGNEILLENLTDKEIRDLILKHKKFNYSHKKMEKLSKEKDELDLVSEVSLSNYINGKYKTSVKARKLCLYLLNNNFEKIKESLEFEKKIESVTQNYVGIVLDENSDKLFVLSNNAIVHNCTRSLGGGGLESLRIDRQGKCSAQVLLTLPIKAPIEWLNTSISKL